MLPSLSKCFTSGPVEPANNCFEHHIWYKYLLRTNTEEGYPLVEMGRLVFNGWSLRHRQSWPFLFLSTTSADIHPVGFVSFPMASISLSLPNFTSYHFRWEWAIFLAAVVQLAMLHPRPMPMNRQYIPVCLRKHLCRGLGFFLWLGLAYTCLPKPMLSQCKEMKSISWNFWLTSTF